MNTRLNDGMITQCKSFKMVIIKVIRTNNKIICDYPARNSVSSRETFAILKVIHLFSRGSKGYSLKHGDRCFKSMISWRAVTMEA